MFDMYGIPLYCMSEETRDAVKLITSKMIDFNPDLPQEEAALELSKRVMDDIKSATKPLLRRVIVMNAILLSLVEREKDMCMPHQVFISLPLLSMMVKLTHLIGKDERPKDSSVELLINSLES